MGWQVMVNLVVWVIGVVTFTPLRPVHVCPPPVAVHEDASFAIHCIAETLPLRTSSGRARIFTLRAAHPNLGTFLPPTVSSSLSSPMMMTPGQVLRRETLHRPLQLMRPTAAPQGVGTVQRVPKPGGRFALMRHSPWQPIVPTLGMPQTLLAVQVLP
jgi:hypothetical protein